MEEKRGSDRILKKWNLKNQDTLVISVALIALLGITIYLYSRGVINLTGLAISERITNLYSRINLTTILIGVILLLLVFFMIIYGSFKEKKQKQKVRAAYSSIRNIKTRSSTQIDALLELLKKVDKVKISIIADVFKVKKDIAMEWAKILEEHDMIEINYPALFETNIEIKKEKEGDKKKEGLDKKLEKHNKMIQKKLNKSEKKKKKVELKKKKKEEKVRKKELKKQNKISKKIEKKNKKIDKDIEKNRKKVNKKLMKLEKQRKKLEKKNQKQTVIKNKINLKPGYEDEIEKQLEAEIKGGAK